MDWESSKSVMELWSYKLRRSGYLATMRNEVIKTVCEKWDRICEEEDGGGRLVHRPRAWREKERRVRKKRRGRIGTRLTKTKCQQPS